MKGEGECAILKPTDPNYSSPINGAYKASKISNEKDRQFVPSPMGNKADKVYNDDADNTWHVTFVKAAALGDVKMVEAMLERDNPVDMNCQYHSIFGDKTALYKPTDQGNVAMVQVLLQAGANVNIPCFHQKWTALHAACSHCLSIELVEELLKAGADVNMKASVNTKEGYTEITPLLCVVLYFRNGTVFDKNWLQIAHLLLEAKCNVNCEAYMYVTAMSLACAYDLDELIPLLMEYGAIIPPGAYFRCQFNKRTDTIFFLLEHGLDINAKDLGGKSALYYVAAHQRLDLVWLLLDHNADVSIWDQTNKYTPLMAAINQMYFHISWFAEHQILLVCLLLQCMALTNKNLIYHQDYAGYTALHLAAREGSRLIVQEILNWKLNLFLQSHISKESALHYTIGFHNSDSKQLETLKCLFKHINGFTSADYDDSQNRDRHSMIQQAMGCSIYQSFMKHLSSVVLMRI